MSQPIPFIFGQRAVFIKHNGFTREMSADDIFAECLAEGDSAAEAARRAGFGPGTASHHTQRLCRSLGGQSK